MNLHNALQAVERRYNQPGLTRTVAEGFRAACAATRTPKHVRDRMHDLFPEAFDGRVPGCRSFHQATRPGDTLDDFLERFFFALED
jgi:hypothetical protein